jgi:hypothetical protein
MTEGRLDPDERDGWCARQPLTRGPTGHVAELGVCRKCFYDRRIPGITFDATGPCNYCQPNDEMELQYRQVSGAEMLGRIVDEIKQAGKDKPPTASSV